MPRPIERLAYRVASFFLALSGKTGLDAWKNLQRRAEAAERMATRAQVNADKWCHDRTKALLTLDRFVGGVRNADALLALGDVDGARRQLQVAFVVAKGAQ